MVHAHCMLFAILGNTGVTHSLPTALYSCSGYGMCHAWVIEDEYLQDIRFFNFTEALSAVSEIKIVI